MEFKILESIGAGGEGDVYKAQIKENNSSFFVSAKRLHDKRIDVKNLQNWIEIFKDLKSCQIQKPIKIISHEHNYYILSEWIDGITLEEQLSRSNPTLKSKIEILLSLSRAVKSLHSDNEKTILHLDLNPKNILINGSNVYLIDLGLGRLITKDKEYTQTEFFRGTLPYSAPEVIQNNSLSKASDIYSLGVIFYESISGIKLFREASQVKQIDLIINSEVEDLTEVIPGISNELSKLVQRMIDKNHKSRPSINEIIEILEEILSKGIISDIVKSEKTISVYKKSNIKPLYLFSGIGFTLSILIYIIIINYNSNKLPTIGLRHQNGTEIVGNLQIIRSSMLRNDGFRDSICYLSCRNHYLMYYNLIDEKMYQSVKKTSNSENPIEIIRFFQDAWSANHNSELFLKKSCNALSECKIFYENIEKIRTSVSNISIQNKTNKEIKVNLFKIKESVIDPFSQDKEKEVNNLFLRKSNNRIAKIESISGYGILKVDAKELGNSPNSCADFGDLAFIDYYMSDINFWQYNEGVARFFIFPSGFEPIQTDHDFFKLQKLEETDNLFKENLPLICYYERNIKNNKVSLYLSQWKE